MGSMMSQRLYKKPLLITYSGGKDSDVLLHLAEISGAPFEVLYSLTTADAPETVRHVYDTFKRLEENGIRCYVDKHDNGDGTRTTMWNLIPKKLMPPTRVVRYCCTVLKEGGGKDRMIATGVRWDESPARRKNRGALEVIASKRDNSLILSNDNSEDRQLFESCQMKGKRVVNPIIDWTDENVLAYCEAEHIQMNPLYSCGFKRVGCIGCPMGGAKQLQAQFARYPKYKEAYARAFQKMLNLRKEKGLTTEKWETPADVFHWLMDDGVLPGQMELEGMEDA